MDATEQESAVTATADEHASAARSHLNLAQATGSAPDETYAVIHALLALEARLNEITYRLYALKSGSLD